MTINLYATAPIPSESTMEGKILAKLKGLGVSGVTIGTPQIGPIVTGYPLNLSNSTSIKKILSKTEDIALSLAVESIDIRRISGELIVFVPNKDRKIIDFKDALYWYLKDEKVAKMRLPILLGMDYMGHNSAIDLAEQPHILIAGSTGSGKSVFESSIIAALAMLKKDFELDIYLVDTKKLDLSLFEDLSQVKKLVETKEDWQDLYADIMETIEQRNIRLKSGGFRNINEYNDNYEMKMAHKIIIIDELADLSARFSKGVFMEMLQNIIQIARASGIHIIACTQSTRVETVSGTVKANFPTRIALKLPSGIDSRVILDENGAENLLGKGDMLVRHSSSDQLQRYHAPFVQLGDIQRIITQKDSILESMGLK